MDLTFSIVVWIVIGASAGGFASRIVGTDAHQGALANISIGILGALVAGLVTVGLLTNLGYEHLEIAGLAGALFGSSSLTFGWQAIARRRA
jgi:uncharacterized membrane protein YeaQ/YmgE (transglycosylase-associated protein family)